MSDITDISELRAKAAKNDASKWNPQDAIKGFADELATGAVNPDCLIICYTEIVDGKQQVGYRNVTPSGLIALGILDRVKWHIQNH